VAFRPFRIAKGRAARAAKACGSRLATGIFGGFSDKSWDDLNHQPSKIKSLKDHPMMFFFFQGFIK